MMKESCYIRGILCALGLLFFLNGCTSIRPALEISGDALKDKAIQFDYKHYELFLQDYVHDGLVDYQAAKRRPDDLDMFYAQLAAHSPDSDPGLFPTQNDQLAYWLNAYNATVIQGVLTYYPIESVTIQANETAAMNRLTISVEVTFTNNVDESQSYKSSFSRYEDYPSTQDLNTVKDGLIDQINDMLVQDIFDKSVVNW